MIKLSTAMRKGAKRFKWSPEFGEYAHEMDGEIFVCAWGAAAAGAYPSANDADSICEAGTKIVCKYDHVRVVFPIPGHGALSLFRAVIKLSDKEKWPPNKIADWLEGMLL